MHTPTDAPSAAQITLLLRAWGKGDDEALEDLTPLVYRELYRSAQRQMAREKPGHVLQNTALVNEFFLRLAHLRGIDWQDRAHFFAVSARVMRRILTDHARSRLYQKRGGAIQHVPFNEAFVAGQQHELDLVALDKALKDLAAIDERKSQVVELRFFGGLSVEETAEVLQVSGDTVKRDWKFSKHWLLCELSGYPHGH